MATSIAAGSAHYRPDIDGMRAIAVLSVLIFHINKDLLPGGFVGVDIFFVISGFLISKNILQDLQSSQFSLADFYRRRIKRIAPPMFLVIAVTLLVAQVLLLPEDAEFAAESGLWSIMSLANVYFWLYQDTGYFAAPSAQVPLLHLWSLGVEEQFYLLWPLLLMFAYKPGKWKVFFWSIIGVAVGSFLLAQEVFETAPSFGYYMLPTRAGELLLGAASALVTVHCSQFRASRRLGSTLAGCGLLLVVGSIWGLSEQKAFPGWWAVPPTAGAALLILGGWLDHANPVSRLLSIRPLVLIGLVSYSAYLWHWPLLAFYRYGHAGVSLVAGICIFSLTFLCAWATYHFIEKPARRSTATFSDIFLRQFAIPAVALCMACVVAMKIDGYGLRWFSEDYKKSLIALRNEVEAAHNFKYVCQRQRLSAQDVNNENCVLGPSSTKPAGILWGDSNASHYVGMVGTFANASGFQFRNVAVGACPPVLTDPAPFVQAARLADCRASLPHAMDALQKHSVVIISAAWPDYQRRSEKFLNEVFATANTLVAQGKRIVLIGKLPTIPEYDRQCWEKALSYPFVDCLTTAGFPSAEVVRFNAALKDFADKSAGKVWFFDVTPYVCNANGCSPYGTDGQRLYFDPDHLSMPASWAIGSSIVRAGGVPTVFNAAFRARTGAEPSVSESIQ